MSTVEWKPQCPVCGRRLWRGDYYEDRGGQRWCKEHKPAEL